jgi:hypothetical protein
MQVEELRHLLDVLKGDVFVYWIFLVVKQKSLSFVVGTTEYPVGNVDSVEVYPKKKV